MELTTTLLTPYRLLWSAAVVSGAGASKLLQTTGKNTFRAACYAVGPWMGATHAVYKSVVTEASRWTWGTVIWKLLRLLHVAGVRISPIASAVAITVIPGLFRFSIMLAGFVYFSAYDYNLCIDILCLCYLYSDRVLGCIAAMVPFVAACFAATLSAVASSFALVLSAVHFMLSGTVLTLSMVDGFLVQAFSDILHASFAAGNSWVDSLAKSCPSDLGRQVLYCISTPLVMAFSCVLGVFSVAATLVCCMFIPAAILLTAAMDLVQCCSAIKEESRAYDDTPHTNMIQCSPTTGCETGERRANM